MKKFFFPRSVAIFGVSSAPSNLGRVIAENMYRIGFKGKLFLIGDRDDNVMGRRLYRNIEEVEEVPDQAVFLIPAKGLPQAIDECGRKGIQRIIIESGGFSEFEEDRKTLEKEILTIAKKWNIKIIGPNCVGIINAENGLALPFYPVSPQYIKQGPVSLISQSGGLIHDIMLLSLCENVGIGKFVSIGNKLMLDENDFLEFMISDPDTRIIGLYLESIKDGRRLMNLALSTDKPIVLLKSNISPSSSRIAKFHTSALAGDDKVLDAALKQAGIHRVYTLEEMIECFKIFLLPPMRGTRLAIMSRSGGHAVLSTDAAYRYRFELAEFSDEFLKTVKQKTRAGVIRMTNPLDLGDVFDINFYSEIAKSTLKEKDIDGLVIVHPCDFENELPQTIDFIRNIFEITNHFDKPVAFSLIADKKNWFTVKEAAPFPIFKDVDHAIKMLAKSYEHYRFHGRPKKKVVFHSVEKTAMHKPVAGYRIMPPDEVFRLLSSYGIPVAEYAIVNNLEQAINKSKRIGYPVVLKIASSKVLHKTEERGVILNIADDKTLKNAFHKMRPGAYLIQKMCAPGYELIIGGKRDSNFGPVVLFGLGGVFAEMFNDVVLRVAPIDKGIAEEMMNEIKGARILKGFRGQKELDRNALAHVLVNVSRLLIEHPEITNLDINPVIVFEKGKGCVCVDGKIECGGP
ncbi:MAG TPA: acetate--CoA ligase family protein [Syntrophorhabdaceae bacterium]|nr:acetate--CoA ligase family protein [Syntrophorhabdaceae bacterium]